MRNHLTILLLGLAGCRSAEPSEQAKRELPPLHIEGRPYRTPRAGQGFNTEVFGREVTVDARDRRSVTAWDIGAQFTPGPSGQEALPFASAFLWRRPDENSFFRATLVGFFDEIVYAHSPEGWGNLETVLTFENLYIPTARSEIFDGVVQDGIELDGGYVRAGFGIGYREDVAPGNVDNMRSASLTIEPGYVVSNGGSETAGNFVEPVDTFEVRLHASFRWDAIQRNLLELPHEGFALGADAIAGHRSDWDDWGLNGVEDGDEHRDFRILTAYVARVGGFPFVDSERHRWTVSFHGGLGDDVDRFSAARVGGGPQGEEFGSLSRPLLPGAAINEFFPENYGVLLGEYRYEPIFFTYVSLRGSVAYLDRDRLRTAGVRREEDVLGSLGLRLTTGFFFESRLQFDYNYNGGVIRDGEFGGEEFVFHISRGF